MKIEETINKNKKIFLYSVLALSIIAAVFLVTYTILSINDKNKGSVEYTNTYYDIKTKNVNIDYDTTTKVVAGDEVISIYIDDLNTYQKTNSINIELYNIGSIDAIVDNVYVSSIDTNVNKDDIKLEYNLLKGDTIKAGEVKMLKIDITSNSDMFDINDYYNFNINISYRELVN